MKLILLGCQKYYLPVSIVSSYISVWLLRSIKIVKMLSIILINNAKGCLAQSVRLPGGTPQVLSSTPHGSKFQAEVKKIPSPVTCAKAL